MKILVLHHTPTEQIFPIYRASSPNVYANEKIIMQDLRGKELGIARIINIERVSLWDKSNYNVPKITEVDAKRAGFKNLGHMRRIFENRNDGIIVPLYKLTLRRELDTNHQRHQLPAY